MYQDLTRFVIDFAGSLLIVYVVISRRARRFLQLQPTQPRAASGGGAGQGDLLMNRNAVMSNFPPHIA